MTEPFQVINRSILGHAISKSDSLRCFVFCGPASKTCGFSLLALAFKWHWNCHKYSVTQQAVGGAWLVEPQLKLPHAIYCLGMPHLYGTSRKAHTY